jgi:thymidylate synthase
MIGNKFHVTNVAELYEAVSDVLLNAKNASPRGSNTRELIAPQIIIEDPRERLVYNKYRKFNLLHALTEAIMLHSPSDEVKHISEFNKNMAKFSDDGIRMYGSYGKRVSSFIPYIVRKLKEDSDSRQAVLSIHQSIDLVTQTKDVPCTENLQFLIRDNKLILITNMRSNDILYGFQYDVVMFTLLQETIANELGIEVGQYIHNPGSLHVYENYFDFNGYEMLEQMRYHSEPIYMRNNSTVNEWKNLSQTYTGFNENILSLKGTAREIMRLIQIERLYRKDRDTVNNHQILFSPEWAKPFIKRWGNK